MRKIYFSLLSLLFTIATISAQNPELSELLDRLTQNYMGSINDVFSTEELDILTNHFSELNTNSPDSKQILNRRFSSTKGNTPVAVVSIDAEELTIETHGSSPLLDFEGGGVARFDPAQNVFVIDNSNRLYIRGFENNTYEQQGMIMNIPPGESITGAEVMSNGDIFMVATNGTNSSHLFTLNPGPGTPTATPIGGNNGLIVPINLMRDASDNLFTLDIDDDNVYGINKTTGVATLVGSAGFDANFGQGASYDRSADLIVMAAFNATIGDSELRTMNPTTGFTTSLGTITSGVIDQFGWIGDYDADLLAINNASLENFNFYPNPSHDKLFLHAANNIDSITIISILGQEIIQKDIDALSTNLDIAQLLSGTYILRVTINGETGSYQFIKK